MMQIDSINLYNESITMGNVIDSKSQKVNFEEIMDNEVKKNASIEELVKNIESNHNAKITISSDFFSATSITGLNNVIIGGDTLEKMKNDGAFCERIMKIIDENCSYSAQQEIRSLSPPAKSAGVIIYPDGSYLCWIESIYSNRADIKRDSNSDDVVIKDIDNIKENQIVDIAEQINNFGIVPDISVIDKKRSK